MICLPLIERELRAALRKTRPARSRLIVASLAVGASFFFITAAHAFGERLLGRRLEQALFLAALFFVVRVPFLAADTLAHERRNQTLGLLFLTGLGPGEIFASKFLSASLVAFTNLLAIFPAFALPFLLGGVSLDVFLGALCLLPTLMFFALAVSLLASTLTRDETAAIVLSILIALILAGTPAVIWLASSAPAGRWASALPFSPALSPWLVWNRIEGGFLPGEGARFWHSVAFIWLWTFLALSLAAALLHPLWRRSVERKASFAQIARPAAAGWRRRRLARWLDRNPFAWLAARQGRPVAIGWSLVLGSAAAWLGGWALCGHLWLGMGNFILTAFLLNLALSSLIRFTAAQDIAAGRQDGSYEALLTTPLEPAQIVQGELDAVRWRFRPLADFVAVLCLILAVQGIDLVFWNTTSALICLSLWITVFIWNHCACRAGLGLNPILWASLNCARPGVAFWRTSLLPKQGWLIIMIVNFRLFGGGLRHFPNGSASDLIILSCFLVPTVMAATTWFGWFDPKFYRLKRGSMRDFYWDPSSGQWLSVPKKLHDNPAAFASRLVVEFRDIVREPIPESGDRRFKTWNPASRFPSKTYSWSTSSTPPIPSASPSEESPKNPGLNATIYCCPPLGREGGLLSPDLPSQENGGRNGARPRQPK